MYLMEKKNRNIRFKKGLRCNDHMLPLGGTKCSHYEIHFFPNILQL